MNAEMIDVEVSDSIAPWVFAGYLRDWQREVEMEFDEASWTWHVYVWREDFPKNHPEAKMTIANYDYGDLTIDKIQRLKEDDWHNFRNHEEWVRHIEKKLDFEGLTMPGTDPMWDWAQQVGEDAYKVYNGRMVSGRGGITTAGWHEDERQKAKQIYSFGR